MTGVTITCTANGRVHWTATVVNSGPCTVNTTWKAQLQKHVPGTGAFTVALNTTGGASFPPGTTTINGSGTFDFCYAAPANVNSIRVEVKLDASFGRCTPKKKSPSIPPCVPNPPCAAVFSDLPSDAPFYAEVMALQSAGVVSGYADGTFRPNAPVTRAQAARMLAAAFGLNMDAPGPQRFTDVPASDPNYGYVEAAAARGWVSGYADGTFRPHAPVTRGQAAKMVVLAGGYKLVSPDRPTFTDVPAGSTFYSYIETTHAHDLLAGYADGSFRPGAEAGRGQLARMVYGAAFPPEE